MPGISLPVRDGAYICYNNALAPFRTIDDFERGNLSPYEGATTRFSVVSSPVSQGSNALRADGSENETRSILSRPGDGLDYYPSRGDTIQYEHQVNSSNADVTRFGFFHGGGPILQDSYELHFDVNGGQLILYNDPGPNSSLDRLCEMSVNPPTSGYQTVEIDTYDSGMTVRYRGDSMDTGHTGRDSGGVLFSTGGFRAYWDNIRAI